MANSTSTSVGHTLAKVLRIKLRDGDVGGNDGLTRGESVFSVSTADDYIEPEPTSAEWIEQVLPSGHDVLQYFMGLFPFVHWIGRYNLQWLLGDLIAGVTVGAVVVPQGMAYAALAGLAPQFGLYSSFMGVLVYWFFATSKDITIGPVAVLSTVTGNVVANVASTHPQYPGHVVASALAIIAGAIVCFIGLARCGWIVDFISLAAISAFMTGSALNIAVGQVPTMMGISVVNTRDATYLVVINTLKHLRSTTLDAAMGLTALTMLYLIRSACNYGARHIPSRRKTFFYVSTLRTVFVILLYTMISWLVNMHHRSKPKFKILGNVPRGFQNAAVPIVTKDLISSFLSDLPATVIVLLIEHIAIAKSFGRVNNYTINPSQELVAIGVTNLLGPFLGAYPATGSFSRTAIKSKAGVRTPLAGVITAIVVLLAIYALPAVFFYIPSASLAAVIIHAVGDLITPPNTVYQFWRISPLEVGVFFVGVIVTVFSSIEDGIYTTICTSLAILLFRLVKARGRFLGRVKVHSVVGDHLLDGETKNSPPAQPSRPSPRSDSDDTSRDIFLPMGHHDGSNPQVSVERPYPGIFIYRFSEGFNYPNANHYLDYMVAEIFKHTRRTNPNYYLTVGDRPWNDAGSPDGTGASVSANSPELPTLKAIILDFSSVNNVDITSVQVLIDVRNQLDRYASPNRVDWHLACINNRWTKRALASAGFGYPSPKIENVTAEVDLDAATKRWKPIFSVAEIGGSDSAAAAAASRDREDDLKRIRTRDLEHGNNDTKDHTKLSENAISPVARDSGNQPQQARDWAKDVSSGPGVSDVSSVDGTDILKDALRDSKAYASYKNGRGKVAVVHGVNRPLFHIDLQSALHSAVSNAQRNE